ncbi:MAG: FIST N-terminal domain-containing protein [Burkholderiaceae bacterium]
MSLRCVHAASGEADAQAAWAAVHSQLAAQAAQAAQHGGFAPTLAFVYLTDHHAAAAETLLAGVRSAWPGIAVTGCSGIGVAATGTEYFDQPGLAVMLANLPRERFTLFSGRSPLPRDAAWAALVHADGATPELQELVDELSERVQSRYLFGGIAQGRTRTVLLADAVFDGGLAGVAFDAEVALVSRVTQGCQPVGRSHRITRGEGSVVLALDDEPALTVLLRELGVDLAEPRRAVPVLRSTLVGLSDAGDAMLARGGQFGTDTRVRHLIGLDPNRLGFAVADSVAPDMQLAFCQRHVEAARRDLVRICTEVREEVEAGATSAVPAAAGTEAEPRRIAGAIYVSCNGRGGAHFGAPSAELQIIQRALGPVPLVGFFAGGEIARHHLYGYTGVLTAFVA